MELYSAEQARADQSVDDSILVEEFNAIVKQIKQVVLAGSNSMTIASNTFSYTHGIKTVGDSTARCRKIVKVLEELGYIATLTENKYVKNLWELYISWEGIV